MKTYMYVQMMAVLQIQSKAPYLMNLIPKMMVYAGTLEMIFAGVVCYELAKEIAWLIRGLKKKPKPKKRGRGRPRKK